MKNNYVFYLLKPFILYDLNLFTTQNKIYKEKNKIGNINNM